MLARERLRVIAVIALAFLPLALIETAIIGQQAQAGRENIEAGQGVEGKQVAFHEAVTQTRSAPSAT